MTNIITLIGFPGSGKTTAKKAIKENFKGDAISTGDIVRELASDELGEDYTSDELGEWSTNKRENDSKIYATKEALNRVENNLAVLEGIRCKEEIEYINRQVEKNIVLYIDVPFNIRYKRLVSRGREGEDKMEEKDLRKRDKREKRWGLEEVISENYYDVKINGNVSKEDFRSKVTEIVNKNIK